MKLKLLAVLLFASPLFAQTATPPATPPPAPTPSSTFSVSAQAIALPGGGQTVAGTVVGGTFNLTTNFSLRSDNVLAPANNFQGYFGGVQYALPLTKLIAKTTLPKNTFQAYLTASAGIDRIVPANGSAAQHFAELIGGGINYSPSSNGIFNVNLIEVRYARLPGMANNTAIISSGISLHF